MWFRAERVQFLIHRLLRVEFEYGQLGQLLDDVHVAIRYGAVDGEHFEVAHLGQLNVEIVVVGMHVPRDAESSGALAESRLDSTHRFLASLHDVALLLCRIIGVDHGRSMRHPRLRRHRWLRRQQHLRYRGSRLGVRHTNTGILLVCRGDGTASTVDGGGDGGGGGGG